MLGYLISCLSSLLFSSVLFTHGALNEPFRLQGFESVATWTSSLRAGQKSNLGVWGSFSERLSLFFPSRAGGSYVLFYLKNKRGSVIWKAIRRVRWDSRSGVFRADLFFPRKLRSKFVGNWGGVHFDLKQSGVYPQSDVMPEIQLMNKDEASVAHFEGGLIVSKGNLGPKTVKGKILNFHGVTFFLSGNLSSFLQKLSDSETRQIRFYGCSFFGKSSRGFNNTKDDKFQVRPGESQNKLAVFRDCLFLGVQPLSTILNFRSVAFERVRVVPGWSSKNLKENELILRGEVWAKGLQRTRPNALSSLGPQDDLVRVLGILGETDWVWEKKPEIKKGISLADNLTTGEWALGALVHKSGRRGELAMAWTQFGGLGPVLLVSGLASCGGGGEIQVGGAGGSDTTPPLAGQISVNNEPGSPGSDQPNKLIVRLNGFKDPESGIKKIEYSLGRRKGVSDLQPWTKVVGNTIDHSFDLIPISDFYLNLRATNNANLLGEVQSKKIRTHAIIPYTVKKNKVLDLLGVKVTALDFDAKVWIPGDGTQVYPGGWVTPGRYLVELNVPRIHDGTDGTLLGKKIPGRQIFAGIYNFDQKWEGWPGQDFSEPSYMTPNLWGEKKIITLKAGDTLHLSYSPPINGLKNKHNSDGMVVNCVKDKVEFRGGLWGLGFTGWNGPLWNKFRKRVKLVSKELSVSYGSFSYGPNNLPYPLPTEFAQTAKTSEQTQGNSISRWVFNRAIDYLKNGSLRQGSVADAKRLIEFYLNNVQHTFLWGISATSRYYSAYGGVWYPPYLNAQFEKILFASVAFGLDPNYEPLHYLLSLMAQRGNMILPVKGRWTYGNYNVEGGIAGHKDDDSYTKWIWYTMGERNFGFKGGYNIRIWGPSVWARRVLGWPDLSTMPDTLNIVGWGPKKDRYGHVWDKRGLGGGWNTFYSGQEIDGAQWLWFSGLFEDSTLARYARRNYLYAIDPNNVTLTKRKTFYGIWCQNHFVAEPRNPKISLTSIGGRVSFDSVKSSKFSHYRIYFQKAVGDVKILVLDEVKTTTVFIPKSLLNKFGKGVLRVVAVNQDGDESSLSDPLSVP